MQSLKKTGDRLLPTILAVTLVLCAATPALAATDAELTAEADRTEIGVNEPLRVSVTLSSGDEAQITTLPEATGFRLVSRSQSQSSSFSFGSGGSQSRRTLTLNLIFMAERPGDYTFSPARGSAGGRPLQSSALKVHVVPAGKARPPPPRPQGSDEDDADPFEQLHPRPASESDLLLRAEIDRPQVYLGEPVTWSLYLYTRVPVSRPENFKLPSFDAFWSEDVELPKRPTPEDRTIDGVTYKAFLIQQRVLFPLKAGALPLEATEADFVLSAGLLSPGQRLHRVAPATPLKVLPLPTGAPAGFENSNVGQFELSAALQPAHLAVGETATLDLRIRGSGNLRNLNLPALTPPPGLKTFEPTITIERDNGASKLSGTKKIEYLLVPEKEGHYTLASIPFVWFNPETRRYETAATPSLTLDVAPNTSGAGTGTTPSPPSQVNRLSAGDFMPPRLDGSLSSHPSAPDRHPLFLLALLSPFLLWGARRVWALARQTLKPSEARLERNARTRAEQRIRHASNDYAEVSRALENYFAERLGTPLSGLTRPELSERLAAAGLSSEPRATLFSLLDTCDAGRFTPETSAAGASSSFDALSRRALELLGVAGKSPLKREMP